MSNTRIFGSEGVKQIFTPSKSASQAAPGSSSSHENKSQMAFRSGLRSPPNLLPPAAGATASTTTRAPNYPSNLTKSMDQSLLSRHKVVVTATGNEKPWVPTANATRSSPSRGSDSLSRSWTPSSSSKGVLATDLARSGGGSTMASYSPARSTSPVRAKLVQTSQANEVLHNQEEKKNHQQDFAPVVTIGEARLSQLCREDKAKVAKLIAQVTKLRHEVSSQSVSSDSLVLDASSSSLSAAALKVQEKLEHEVSLAQQRLEVLQDDNKKLNGNTELIRSKYARSLEMLKQYQDRLVKLSEEKEDANNASRVMQATESATSSRLLDLEKELRNANEKLSKQQELVDMHATIEQKQETRVRDLETKLTMANKIVKESKVSSKSTRSGNNSSSTQSATASSLQSPTRNKSAHLSPSYSQSGGSKLKRPRSSSPVRSSGIPPNVKRHVGGTTMSRLADSEAQPFPDMMTPRTQARKRLTEVTKEVVSEIENELEKAQQTAEELKGEASNSNIGGDDVDSGLAKRTQNTKKFRKKGSKKDLGRVSFEQIPTVHSIAHVQKIYGATPEAVAHVPPSAGNTRRLGATAPPLSKSMSPDRAQFLRSSSSSHSSNNNNNNNSRRAGAKKSGGRRSGSGGRISKSLISSDQKQSLETNKSSLHEHPFAQSSKTELMRELHRAQDALALLKLEQAKLDLEDDDSQDTSEPEIASPERPPKSTANKTSNLHEQQPRRRKRRYRKKSRGNSKMINKIVSPPPMRVSLSPKLSDSINFYDGTSLLDVIEAVEDSTNGDLSLSSIGFDEEDDLDGISVNTSMDRGNDGPVLYIAPAPRPRTKTRGGRKRRAKKAADMEHTRRKGESSSASVLWSSVGKYLNDQPRRQKSKVPPRAIVEQPGGREGDYWGAYPSISSRTTPARFARRWREQEQEDDDEEEEHMYPVEEYYEESLGGASSKGEPVYR